MEFINQAIASEFSDIQEFIFGLRLPAFFSLPSDVPDSRPLIASFTDCAYFRQFFSFNRWEVNWKGMWEALPPPVIKFSVGASRELLSSVAAPERGSPWKAALPIWY